MPLSMSLLQHARSLWVKAGVKSSIWSVLALSWSWKRLSTSAAPTPTSFIRIRWSAAEL